MRTRQAFCRVCRRPFQINLDKIKPNYVFCFSCYEKALLLKKLGLSARIYSYQDIKKINKALKDHGLDPANFANRVHSSLLEEIVEHGEKEEYY